MNYTYILKCRDGSLYTGWTNDLEKRMKDHNMGRGAKYTKARRPVELAYFEIFQTKEEAMKREYAIKQMSRKKKSDLIFLNSVNKLSTYLKNYQQNVDNYSQNVDN